MKFEATLAWAEEEDKRDKLAPFREEFHFPKEVGGQRPLYFVGNSLGLQPRSALRHIAEEMKVWRESAIEGHLKGQHPWYSFHEFLADDLAVLTGAKPPEVVAMNSLTVNLHLALISFYRPTKERFKIAIESTAFPSDRYAVISHMKMHGFDPKEALIELKPRAGEHCLNTDDIEDTLQKEGKKVALVLIGQVNYLTGQAFDAKRIADVSHIIGAYFALDLAHGIGNIELKLHDWNVDFAVWCSYKYLNSGPGAIAGLFVHEKHGKEFSWPRLVGWWGHDKKKRFLMEENYSLMEGAEGWQVSNPPILQAAALMSSLELFRKAGLGALREKSERLTGFLEFLFSHEIFSKRVTVITPRNPSERGCHLSLIGKGIGKETISKMAERGVYCDYREPGIIRIAPVPLYNSFSDVFQFVALLGELWPR